MSGCHAVICKRANASKLGHEQVERPTVALPAPLTDALQSIQTMLAVEGSLCSTTRLPPRCNHHAAAQ